MTMTETRDLDLVNKLRNLFIIARDHKRVRYDVWIRNYRLVNNRLGGQSTSNWMPAPRDSEIYPTLSSLVAWMTDQEITLDYQPATDPGADIYEFVNHIAADLSTVMMSTWLVEDYASQIKLALWDAFQYGVGIFKSVWDNSLSDGYGNAVLRRVDPWAFYCDPYATSLRDAEYLVEARRMSFDEIERRFPDHASALELSGTIGEGIDERPTLFTDITRPPMANPGQLPTSGTFGSLGPNGVGRFGTSSNRRQLFDPLPGYVVYEYWLRQNRPWFDDYEDVPHPDDRPAYSDKHVQDEWRVVVVCNGYILMDELASELWSHGQHPYERFVFDDTGEFYGISLVDHLAYPQIYINRLLTALQHNAELVGNPILLEAANSGTSRVGVVNRPGQRLTIRGAGGMANNKPEWLNPPSMPDSVRQLVEFWISRIENTSGLSAIQKGATPNQRNAADVIQNVQEAAFVRVRAALHNLECSLRASATKLADLVVDNYTEPRIVAIVGQDGHQTSLALSARHFYVPSRKGATPMKYILQVEAGANTPTSRAARVAESEKLMALGVVDDQYVLETHRIRNSKVILERLYDKRQKGLVGTGPGMRQRAGRTR